MGEIIMLLGLLLVVATGLARLARKLKVPSVPVYIITGLIFGSLSDFLPIHLEYADIKVLASLGLILLLFHLGLEFDTSAFKKNAKSLIAAGVIYIVLNVGAGLLFGWALGWGGAEALTIAGITGISSSAIVTKLMIDLHKLHDPETPLILGIVVIEDVFLAVYLAVLNLVVNPSGGVWSMLLRFLISVAFLVGLFILARRGSALISKILNERTAELFIVGLVGLTLFVAGMAEEVGVSEAIGAFMVGLIVDGTSARKRAEHAILPIRDTFAAVFFIGFGMTLDIASFGGVLWPVLIAVVMTIAVNVLAGVLAGKLQQLGIWTGVEIGLMLLSRGEFALIVATVAANANLDSRIMPFAGLYVLILAIAGPLMVTYLPRLWTPASRQAEHLADETEEAPDPLTWHAYDAEPETLAPDVS